MSEFDEFEKLLASTSENADDMDFSGEFDLTALSEGIKMDFDLVLCIDVTSSMLPIINMVKDMALSLYDDIVSTFAIKKRKVINFRVKVIPFRDYYYDGKYAMTESRFFSLPDENFAFSEYVMGLKAKGGGDEPESALEAIALAMKSDWVKAVSEDKKVKNMIVVFTDASAHPFEKAKFGVTKFYPHNMLTSLQDLHDVWVGRDLLGQASVSDLCRMDPDARRFIIYAPLDSYPWNEISMFPYVKSCHIESAFGGEKLDKETILSDLAGAIR